MTFMKGSQGTEQGRRKAKDALGGRGCRADISELLWMSAHGIIVLCTLYCWSPPQRFSSPEELQENKCANAQRRADLRLDEQGGQVAARLVNSPQIWYRGGIVSSFIRIPIVNVVIYMCTKVRYELNSLFR